MGNILNPLTSTKVDGNTFAAAECNAIGAALPRCLVNDSQSDLLANASISGGANKSFAFVGLTTFGLACSGALTESCGSYALTCTGAATIACAAFALTCAGATIASSANTSIAVSGLNRTLALSTADGNVTVTAGGANSNLTLTAGVDIFFVPGLGGTFGGVADKCLLSGTGWPQIGSRAFASYVPQSAPIVVSGFADQASTPGLIVQNATAGVVDFFLYVPPGATVAGASIRVSPVGSPPSLPTAKPELTLYAIDALTGVVSTLGTAVDPSLTLPAYSTTHAVSVAVTPFVVSASQRLMVRLKGATDADANKWVFAPVAPTLSVTFSQIRLA